MKRNWVTKVGIILSIIGATYVAADGLSWLENRGKCHGQCGHNDRDCQEVCLDKGHFSEKLGITSWWKKLGRGRRHITGSRIHPQVAPIFSGASRLDALRPLAGALLTGGCSRVRGTLREAEGKLLSLAETMNSLASDNHQMHEE